MAENKKSVLLYCDLIHTVKKLITRDREKGTNNAGELFYHYLQYINDLDPKAINDTVDYTFEPIKQSLKRDLKKWEDKIDKRSDAGKKSAGKKSFTKWLEENPAVNTMSKENHLFELGRCKKYQNESYDNGYTVDWFHYEYCIEFHQQMATKSTSVESVELDLTKSTVKDTVTVTVKENVIVKDIIDRKAEFKNSLLAIVENSETPHYEMEMVKDFFEYWTEHGEKDRKMRFEKQTSFSVTRRLATWFKRQKTFNKEKSSEEKEKKVVGRQTLSTIEQNTKGWD